MRIRPVHLNSEPRLSVFSPKQQAVEVRFLTFVSTFVPVHHLTVSEMSNRVHRQCLRCTAKQSSCNILATFRGKPAADLTGRCSEIDPEFCFPAFREAASPIEER